MSLKEKVAFVGIGGCGTNIAYGFEKLGYTTVHVNSSSQDESAIEKAKTIIHLEGYNGCAGNRDKAINAMADNQGLIDYLAKLQENILFLVFSAGGGTGSGIGPTLANILSAETDKTICCIVVLPDNAEDLGYQSNAYACAKELSGSDIGATLFIDNNKIDRKSTLNSRLVYLLDSFINNNTVSKFGNVDEEEKKTIISAKGNMFIAICDNDHATTWDAITADNIFAPLQKDSNCEYLSIINSNNKGIDKELLIPVLGMPRRTFIGYGSSKTIIVASGLDYPLDHIIGIGQNAKTKNNERKIKKTVIELEELDLDDEVVEKPKTNYSRDNWFSKRG